MFSRLTAKDCVKIAVFNTPLVCRKNLILTLSKLSLKVPFKAPVFVSAEFYWIFSKF